MFNDQMKMILQNFMEHKIEDVLKVKKLVDQMDLREFKAQWRNRSSDYSNLAPTDRLKYMVMSIKILQAKADLKRMINSVQELSTHPESQKAIYYYLRTNLWKFLDNFRYILLIDDIRDEDKLECLNLLDDHTEIIAQDEELKKSCLHRLHKLLEQSHILEHDVFLGQPMDRESQIYHQLAQRIVQIIHNLEPPIPTEDNELSALISNAVQGVIRKYSSFSVARISIETSGVLSIIQLLHDHSLGELERHQAQLQEALVLLEQQVLYEPKLRPIRNQCAYALVVVLEIVKMHKGLPVLLLRILNLCSYIQFPPAQASLDRELRELKGKITEITQKRLRPIIEDVLWKNPTYLTKIPHILATCPWCYRKDRENMLNITHIRRVVTSSFDRIEAAPGGLFNSEGIGKSHLSELVIDILGLLVNLEPSPHFLKLHSQEAQMLRQTQKSDLVKLNSKKTLFDQQYTTYKNHLQFLQDSIDYYLGISEKLGHGANGHGGEEEL